MTKDQAVAMQALALEAISKLSSIVGHLDIHDPDYSRFLKAIGLLIADIDTQILLELEKPFPEISDIQ